MKICCGLIASILIVVIFGCAPSHKITTERSLSVNEVLMKVKERNEKIKMLKGDGSITIENNESSNSGSFSVDLKKPDSLRMEFRGPFGIHAASLMLSREQFLFYNWMENTATVGKSDEKTLNTIVRLNMEFDQILNAFAGEVSQSIDGDSLEKFSVENHLYVLQYQSVDGRREYWIDGDSFIVTDYRQVNANGATILLIHASDIEETDNIPVPMFMRVIFPKEHQSVTITYNEVKVNKPVSCYFSAPKQAEIIYR